MSSPAAPNLTKHFANLTDPRVDRTKEHLLLDMVVIAICAILAGADGWVAVEAFGHAKEKWLRTFLALPNGIPSHDTFGRVFAAVVATIAIHKIWLNLDIRLIAFDRYYESGSTFPL